MYYRSAHKKDSTLTIRVVSAIFFGLFSFLWLYWFQADLLALTQHVLSHQQTSYNSLIGAIVITAILLVVQQIVSRMLRLRKHSYALTFVPSALLLAIVSDVYPMENEFFTHRPWWFIAPLILLLWGIVVWAIKQLYDFDERNENLNIFCRQLWLNLFELCLMMFGVSLLGNTNATQHFQAHIERALLKNDFQEALRTGARSHETTPAITMLRAFALSKSNLLGDRLFHYALAGTSEDLLPLSPQTQKPLIFPSSRIFQHLGAQPIAITSVNRYYTLLHQKSLSSQTSNLKPQTSTLNSSHNILHSSLFTLHYNLSGLLLDRDLDTFIRTLSTLLPSFGGAGEAPLPLHFREAIILHNHLRGNSPIPYDAPSMEEDWKNFQSLRSSVVSGHERPDKFHDLYSTSYWYYYFMK